MKPLKIDSITRNSVIDLSLDTLKIKKQALVFVNTKSSAEKTAEDIARKADLKDSELGKLAEEILNAIPKHTKQCERLAFCVKKGIAFHHAGLVAKQRELIEDNFRKGLIKIICCTPTLCISGDSKIWNGFSETEVSKFDKSKPLFVLSKKNIIFMKAQKVEKIKNLSKLIQITSISGNKIKVTPTHKMLIKKKGEKKLVKALDIKKGDKIATIGRINPSRTKTPYLKDFVLDNIFPIKNKKFDLDMYYFIGAMLGDGYSGAETVDKIIVYKGSPSIVSIDKEIFLNTKTICKRLKLDYREGIMFSKTPQLVLSKKKWFREFLCRCGIEQKEKKHISLELMKGELENIAALLRGLFDTDGYVEKSGNIGFANISTDLINQIRKLLLRFGIVSRVRLRKKGKMKIYEKAYETKPIWELNIFHKKNILTFYKHIGFSIERKQKALVGLVNKIESNVNYIFCKNCDYKIYKDVFSGRTRYHNEWGKVRLQIIKLLWEKRELGSKDLKRLLKHQPRNKELRLNHHYEFIKKRRAGSRGNTEWYWSLNPIGEWTFKNVLNKNKGLEEFLSIKNCPLCGKELKKVLKKGWKDSCFEGDIFWDSVKGVKKTSSEEFVYDVVLSEKPKNNHMFVANGFIIHNSYGLDLPAFRAIIKDLRRYTQRGYTWIPVLEYLQQSGRAGRPKFDKYGESIAIASTKPERDEIVNRYLNGIPEQIYSKLAVEPVLRTYVLSLIATGFANNKKELLEFFEKTFWAHQYGDMSALEGIVNKILLMLEEFEFVKSTRQDFVTADKIKGESLKVTILGKRVSELYIDPLTAHHLINCLRKATAGKIKPFSFLQMVSSTLEMRPLLNVRIKEYEDMQEALIKYEEYLLQEEPSLYEPDYEDFLSSIKTAMFFDAWINEKDEEFLLEGFNIRPGEIRVKLSLADWLLYSSEEISKLLQFHSLVKEISKLRFRLKYGVQEELLALLKLKEIGRVRARKLYSNRIRDIGDVKKTDFVTLVQILGRQTALNIKKQVGQDFEKVEVKENKRKGQISLMDY